MWGAARKVNEAGCCQPQGAERDAGRFQIEDIAVGMPFTRGSDLKLRQINLTCTRAASDDHLFKSKLFGIAVNHAPTRCEAGGGISIGEVSGQAEIEGFADRQF